MSTLYSFVFDGSTQGWRTDDQDFEARRVLYHKDEPHATVVAARASIAALRARVVALERDAKRDKRIHEVARSLRCERTNNLCGTDTVPLNRPCVCAPCRVWAAVFFVGLDGRAAAVLAEGTKP